MLQKEKFVKYADSRRFTKSPKISYTFDSDYQPRMTSILRSHTSHKHLLSLLAAFVTVLGAAKLASTYQTRQRAKIPTAAPLFLPEWSNITSNYLQKATIDSTAQYLFSQIASVASPDTSTNSLWLYTCLLQELSTKEDGVCSALEMPRRSFSDFVKMADRIPSEQLQKALKGIPANPFYSFQPLANTLQKNPPNPFAISQETFLMGQRYETHQFLAKQLSFFENSIPYIYWDNAKKPKRDANGNILRDAGGKRILEPNNHPTVWKGLNLDAHPDYLAHIRIKNSPELQKILHPTGKNYDDAEYIRLSSTDLKLLTKHVISNGYTNHKARHFLKNYGLEVHKDDWSYLEEQFQNNVARAISGAERDLEIGKPAYMANESVLFGSYTNPVCKEAAACAADLKFNTGAELCDKNGWPKFSKYYTSRNFKGASQQCSVPKGSRKRNKWRKNQMKIAEKSYQNNKFLHQNSNSSR